MGTFNTLMDLNNHLFEEMERLNDESLSPEALEKEIERAKAMTGVSTVIVQNAGMVLKAMEFADEIGQDVKVSRLLIGSE